MVSACAWGGSSFGTHDISINPQGNLEFQASTSSKIFAGVFMIWGLLFGLIILLSLFGSPNIDFTIIFSFIPAAIFIGIGYIMYRYISQPIIFDKQVGYFYKGKPQMTYGMIDPINTNMIPLSSIYALQIVSERVSTKNSSFLSYEINLILSDKKRVNVVDYGNLEKIQADAKQLGEYLWVSVWWA